MQRRKFGDIRAIDCRMLGIRLPDESIRAIETACGRSAALVLTDIAVEIAKRLSANGGAASIDDIPVAMFQLKGKRRVSAKINFAGFRKSNAI